MLPKPESYFVVFIYLLKLSYIFLSLYKIYIKDKTPYDYLHIQNIQFWKERIEFTFIICMAILLLSSFYPGSKDNPISHDKRVLFFVFGTILIITAKWEDFFDESYSLREVQRIIGQN